MPTLSTFVCKKTIDRLSYVAIKTGPQTYHVVKYRRGTVADMSVDSMIVNGAVISKGIHQAVIDSSPLGYLVFDAKACGFEVASSGKLVGAPY